MKHFLRLLGVISMSAGVTLSIMNGITYTHADLSGGGAVLHPAASSIVMQSIPPNQVMSAYENASTADELAIGILLILLGFFFHAFVTAQTKREERTIPVKIVPKHTAKNHHVRDLYWMEMQV